MTRRIWQSIIAATALPFLAGCSSASPVTPSTVAADAPRVTLRMADAESQGQSSQPWIDKFVNEVAGQSGGTIAIDVLYKVGGGNVDKAGELTVARQVVAGDVELALVPVRAWSDVGVTSLQALEAPMLIDSDALLTAVAADPLTEPLLGAMQEQGIVGLSIWPEDLRHPFTWEQNGPPILEAADLAGAKIWTLPSKLHTTILAGLGATPVNSTLAELDSMVANGSLQAAESSFNAIASLSGKPTGTADVVLYPKYQVLVADDAAFSRLSADQQGIVRSAADAARDLAVMKHVPDAETAPNWCRSGGRVVLAGEARVATFRQAAAPILTKLSEDPVASDCARRDPEAQGDDVACAVGCSLRASGQPCWAVAFRRSGPATEAAARRGLCPHGQPCGADRRRGRGARREEQRGQVDPHRDRRPRELGTAPRPQRDRA